MLDIDARCAPPVPHLTHPLVRYTMPLPLQGGVFMHETTVTTDDVLLAAALRERNGKGNAGAFEKLLAKYERLIHHIARRYFRNPEDALDACQDAAIRIYKGLPKVALPETGSLKSWICTVTANACLDELRKRKTETDPLPEDGSGLESTIGTEHSAEESAIARERVREILAAMEKLPDDYRMILILRDMQSLSYDELAAALSLNVGTVKSRLSRARGALKNILDGA